MTHNNYKRERMSAAAAFHEASVADRRSPEYRRGLRQLAEWHKMCAEKRKGVSRE